MKILQQADFFITLYSVIDDLYKKITPFLIDKTTNTGRKPKLSTPELITIGIIFMLTDCNSFKGFYHLFRISNLFPNMPEYSRLLRNVKKATGITVIMVKILLEINRSGSDGRIKVIDSMPLKVCNNKRIFNYKVTELADRGISSMGWFYGFKLHAVVDKSGKLLSIKITPGNVSDKNHRLVMQLFKGLRGLAIGDGGYLSKPLAQKLLNQGVLFITGLRKTMKKLMTTAQHKLLKLRQIIETVFGNIKYRTGCESSLPRSLNGYFWRYLNATFLYLLCYQLF